MESAGFAGGRFVVRDGSIVPMIHVTDHLGSVRAVVDGVLGEVVETNDYYPFGSRWNTAANLTANTNRFRYNSKEEQSSLYPESVRNAVSYIDYGARQYDPVLGRWFAQDPLSEKYYGISPYAFCNNNPINFVDPDGLDWYSYIEKDEDKSQNEYITKYAWTDATSQEELEASGVNGTYLGQAVVIFNGFEDEKLGEDGKLTGEGAKPAEVTIYGINGPGDIASYKGLSVSSDPSKYSMIQEGEYKLFHQQMSESIYGRGSLTYRLSNRDGTTRIKPVGGVNKYNNKSYMEGIFFHRTDNDGTARKSSKGCLVVDGRSWTSIEKQLGKSNNIYLKLSRR